MKSRSCIPVGRVEIATLLNRRSTVKSVGEKFDNSIPVLEVITDPGSEFFNPRPDDRPYFERYLAENDIEHMFCKVGRPQSNGKIKRFFQIHEKHRQQ